MKVMRWTEASDGPVLVEDSAPVPEPGAGEILVRVHAAAVTPAERHWYPTTHSKEGGTRTGAVPAHEFSGVIAATGAGISGFFPGDEVFGMNDWFADGATAEYCISQAAWIAPKPSNLTHAEAATVPISALTAWQGLILRAKIRPDDHVLVHGGAGAVGIFAVQLARMAGAHVIATASSRNIDFLLQIGAENVIDRTTTRFENEVSGVDIIFDTVGGDTLERSWPLLKPGGRMVTIASDIESSHDERAKSAFFIVEASGEQLSEIGQLLEKGTIRPALDNIVPFANASIAYDGTLKRNAGRGKVAVRILP
jgi:NADPH:quinone reductase-like Zn-dependent oxidoreductase